MNIGKHSAKWSNSAARRRLHAAQRARLARMLGWSVECIATTGEMIQIRRDFEESGR